MTSNFSFLQNTYPELFKVSELAERLFYIDPSSSISKTRLFSEKITTLIWEFKDLEAFDGTQLERIFQLYNRNIIPEFLIPDGS